MGNNISQVGKLELTQAQYLVKDAMNSQTF